MAMPKKLKILAVSCIAGILTVTCIWFCFGIDQISAYFSKEPELTVKNLNSDLVLIHGNSLVSVSDLVEETVTKEIRVVMTGYSSSPEETDSTPFITANGTMVREGIVANNLFPFGTRIRIPELYENKIFVVEDRMNRRKSYYHVDIWFSSKEEALNFGVKRTHIEVLEG